MTEEQRKENSKVMSLYMSIIAGVILGYFFGYAGSLTMTEGTDFFTSVGSVIPHIKEGQFLFALNGNSILGMGAAVFAAALIYFFLKLDYDKNHSYKADEIAGTGGFMDKKQMKEYADKYIAADPPALEKMPAIPEGEEIKAEDDAETKKKKALAQINREKKLFSSNMIMSNSFCRPIDSRKLIGNNNVLIVGGAGTGKSRFVMKPNILQMNASYIITDPSGEMILSVGQTLKDHGYKIKIFNISDMGHSNTYNPLNYIRDEAGVKMLIECLISNTTKGDGGGDNQFFVDAEQLLYSACIFYLIDFCNDDSKKNFANIMNMINASSVNEQNANEKSPLDKLFDKCPQDSLAWKYYKAFKQAAGKTLKSIIISCVTRLQPFMTPQVVNLTSSDEMELNKLGDEKTALFIITPQADRTYAFLASMLYSQMFETLYHIGEQQKASGESEQLHIPVRCLMDEFANIGEVPEFPSKLSTMRKYNISATVVLQDIAQIEAMYKDNWKTLVGNCSSIVFLGTQEPNTLKYFSEMLGKKTIRTKSTGVSSGKGGSSKNFQQVGREVMTQEELARMPSDECIVFTQNMRPVRDKKYKYERHPYYNQTADANPELGFTYNQMSAYDNTKAGSLKSILKAKSEMKAHASAVQLKRSENVEKLKEVQGEPQTMVNQVQLPSESVKKLISAWEMKCSMQLADVATDKLPITTLDIPSKYLSAVIDGVSQRLNILPMMVASVFNVTNDDDCMVALVKCHSEEKAQKLKDLLDIKPGVENAVVNGNYIMLIMFRKSFDEYRAKAKNIAVPEEKKA
jgi:type IV secretory pathway TraG/TraD family ATPase VirD4